MSSAKEPSQTVCLLFPGQRVIYEITREWVTWLWLCPDCAAALPYPKKKIGETDQACDHCDRKLQPPVRPGQAPVSTPAFRLEVPA